MKVEKRNVVISFKGKRSESETIKKAALIERDTASEFMRTTILQEAMRIIKRHERNNK